MGVLHSLSLHINRFFVILSCISALIVTGIAAGNMLLRIIYRPIQGSYELIGFFGAVSVALALGYTQLRKDHVIVTIVTDRFSDKVKNLLDRFSYLVSSIFFSVVFWQTFKWGLRIAKSGELSETLKIIYHPFVYLVAIGFLILSFTSLVDFIISFRGKEK